MWQGILGHDDVVERFRQSLAEGRLASCYLFLGPEGVGKRTFALKLAQALLCQNAESDSLTTCGNCESCMQAVAENHPDMDVVRLPEGKRRMPVELFLGDRDHRHREGLCHNIALRPQLGRRRVAIIEDADHLTVESSNCLLKTLEEPPAGAVLILIATSRSRLLPTILSRTQVIRFQALSTDVLEKLLVEQQIVSDSQQARAIAQNANGSLHRGRELADPELRDLREPLLSQMASAGFDSVSCAALLTDFVNQAGKSPEARRQRLRSVFHLIGNHFRELLRLSCSPEESSVSAPESASRHLQLLGPAAQSSALAALDRCLEAEIQLDRNANQATLLECWLDDLAGLLTPA